VKNWLIRVYKDFKRVKWLSSREVSILSFKIILFIFIFAGAFYLINWAFVELWEVMGVGLSPTVETIATDATATGNIITEIKFYKISEVMKGFL